MRYCYIIIGGIVVVAVIVVDFDVVFVDGFVDVFVF
jgi:hypothetical protein